MNGQRQPLRIYVASSWRNQRQPDVVAVLRQDGHDVYDFRHPAPGDDGFAWSEIDPAWQSWSMERFRDALRHPTAARGYRNDFAAMRRADVCVLVAPCGRSAHLEAGWFAGAPWKYLVILLADGEPELMYRMADYVCVGLDEVRAALRAIEEEVEPCS